jgi:hypothetical protein
MSKVMIDGKEHEYTIFYKDVPKFLVRWNSQYEVCKRDFEKRTGEEFNPEVHQLTIPNEFYFWCCWQVLRKRGRWPFKKPYRSMWHMMKYVRKEEFQGIVSLVGRDILELNMSEEGREPGNVENRRQSQNTLQQ